MMMVNRSAPVSLDQEESKDSIDTKHIYGVESNIDKCGTFYIQYYLTPESLKARIAALSDLQNNLYGPVYDMPVNMNDCMEMDLNRRGEDSREKETKGTKAFMGESRKIDNFDLILTGLD
jgi:hypothetical protein